MYFPAGSEIELISPPKSGFALIPSHIFYLGLEVPISVKKSSSISPSPTHSQLDPVNHLNLLIPNPKHLLTQFPFLATTLIQALYHLLFGLGSRLLNWSLL